ncbi:P-loop containing nucleoside triphosphate hydrolase, partial [Perkinsela sp. CCAP 1560/4]
DVPKKGLLIFSEKHRPVPLDLKVLSYGNHQNPYYLDTLLTSKLRSVLEKYSGSKPSIVFCASRREAEKTAHVLSAEVSRQNRKGFLPSLASARASYLEFLQKNEVDNESLRSCLKHGIGFHHAALSPRDRRTVEEHFSEDGLHIICCTSTLALGVNFPARLVVVKGTTCYKGGARVEMHTTEICQMIGRAGRAGYDSKGIGVILTTDDRVGRYTNLFPGSGESNVTGFSNEF